MIWKCIGAKFVGVVSRHESYLGKGSYIEFCSGTENRIA